MAVDYEQVPMNMKHEDGIEPAESILHSKLAVRKPRNIVTHDGIATLTICLRTHTFAVLGCVKQLSSFLPLSEELLHGQQHSLELNNIFTHSSQWRDALIS